MDETCPQCGAAFQEGVSACPNCGYSLASAAADPQPAPGDLAGAAAGGTTEIPVSNLPPPAVGGGGGNYAPPPQAGTAAATNPLAALNLSFAQWVLVGSTVLLFISLLLPWWTVSVSSLSFSLNGFHSWGWLSFVAFLAALALSARTLAGKRVDLGEFDTFMRGSTGPKVIVGVGAAEVLGNILFIAVAPTASGFDVSAGISAGVIIALICGLGIIYSGLMMLGVSWLPKPKAAAQ